MTDYIPTTPHLRDSLQHDLTNIKTDVSPTVITSDAGGGFAAVMIFSSDPQQVHNRFVEAYRTFQMVRADAANDASARMGKIHLREEAITVREKEVAGLKALLEQQLKSLQSIVGPTA
jgi:hypothetical protein